VFRRRQRDGADREVHDSSEGEPLAEDDLAEGEEFADDGNGTDEADDFGQFDDEDATGEPGDEPLSPAAARAERDDLGDPATWTRLRDTAAVEPAHMRSAGPWDSGDSFPEAERVDLGCMLVPVREGADIQIAYSDETGVTLAVVCSEGALQLQAFAAPRSGGLWGKVRPEIAEEVAKAGGRSQDQEGPFGPELIAWVTPPAMDADVQLPPQQLRFLGVDGPRWFLRGLINGPAALDAKLASSLEDVFADVVVVRGDHAAAPETPLDIQLPEGARQAFEEQMGAQEQGLPNPFERGPEITETR
jgi:Protein of unknown function (DUF3710)